MTEQLFSIARDQKVIAAGGFFCEACLEAKPLDDQSSDPRYCFECYKNLVEQASRVNPNTGRPKWVPEGAELMERSQEDGWMKDSALFVHHGEKFGIIAGGETASGGPVPGATQTLPATENSVTKIPTNGELPPDLEKAIMLQEKRGKGRPRKAEGEPVSRMTEWRREQQGVLAI